MFLVKIKMPRIGATYVHRKRAESMLSKLDRCKFAFLSAPAGYGKTTAIIDYVNRSDKRCAWVSIDQDDNDPSRFWSCLITSISACTGLSELTNISTDLEQTISHITADALIEAIADLDEPFVIVLDDYHLINNEWLHRSVEHFVKYKPNDVSVVFTSRVAPPKGLALLCVKGFGFTLGREDLAFSVENTKEYFSQNEMHVSEQENRTIHHYSEGWPAGIVAAAMRIHEKGNRNEFSKKPAQVDQNIAAYLESEVFDCWPEETREFLIQTSFLDKLSGSLCSSVTGNDKSAVLLKKLSKSNAFIVSLDSNEEWYRYHHLFQDFLLERLNERGEEEARKLYLRAVDWFSGQNMQSDVIRWLLKAKEYDVVAPMLFEYIGHRITEEAHEADMQQLCKWHQSVPEEYFKENPELFGWRAWVSFMNDDVESAKEWIRKARKSADLVRSKQNQQQRDMLEVNLLIVEINIDIYEQDIVKMLWRVNKMRNCKVSITPRTGDLNWHEACLLNTRYGFMGRLQLASGYTNVKAEMLAYMGDTAAYIATIIAEAAYEQNKLETAIQTLIEFMPSIEKRSGALAPAFILQAKLKCAAGDFEGAFAFIHNARQLLADQSVGVWRHHLDVFEASLQLKLGRYENTSALIRSERLSVHDAVSRIREPEYLVFARMLMHANRFDEALILLKRLETFAREHDRLMSLMEILCLTAICQSKKVDYQSAMLTLKEALKRGNKEDYVRVFVDEQEPMAVLLDRYISQNRNGGAGVYLTYARNLLKLTNDYIAMVNARQQNQEGVKTGPDLLTKTELEIMKYMMQQASNQQIADDLFLSINTIKKYNARIFDKLGVNNRYEAMQKAKQLGLSD